MFLKISIMNILRNIVAVVAGMITGSVVIWLIELLGHSLYPPPEGVDPSDPESVRTIMETIQAGALWMLVLAYAVGALVAGFVAAAVSRDASKNAALITGGVLLIFGLINLLMIPHPVWFWVVSLAVYVPFSWIGYRISKLVKTHEKKMVRRVNDAKEGE